MKSEFLTFESLLREGDYKISDVYKKDNITYFTINGYKFQTYGNNIHHENHPIFDSQPAKIFAHQQNDPEGIVRQEELGKKINDELELWFKHKNSLYKILFIKAVEILGEKGEEEFVEFVDHHLHIMEENDNCKELLKKLEDNK